MLKTWRFPTIVVFLHTRFGYSFVFKLDDPVQKWEQDGCESQDWIKILQSHSISFNINQWFQESQKGTLKADYNFKEISE